MNTNNNITLDLCLYACETNNTDVLAMYWLLVDAAHDLLCKIESDALQDDERTVLFKDVRKYADFQNKLFVQLHTKTVSLLSKAGKVSPSATVIPAYNEAQTAQITSQQREIDLLTNELAYFKGLTQQQATVIGRMKNEAEGTQNGSQSGSGADEAQ